MTFDDYVKQTDPKRFPQVDIKASDFYFKQEVCFGMEVGIVIHGIPYTYFVRPGSKHLYTLDTDGNIRALSCFILDKPLEPKTDAIWPRRWRATNPNKTS